MMNYALMLMMAGLLNVQVKGDSTNWAVNWAVHRPAWQSSTYIHEGTALNASLAVDNKLDPNLKAALDCSHTAVGSAGALSWWAVDLGRNIKVSDVVIIGRNEDQPERLANFNVGVTNSDPSKVAPAPGGYTLCATQGPYIDYRSVLSCNGAPKTLTGRYVVVQFASVSNYLTLCEVQVFGSPA
jgi:hypothetical protein